jgi:hypothetical protein
MSENESTVCRIVWLDHAPMAGRATATRSSGSSPPARPSAESYKERVEGSREAARSANPQSAQ